MGVYGFSSSDDDAEYTPPNEDVDQDKDGDRYILELVPEIIPLPENIFNVVNTETSPIAERTRAHRGDNQQIEPEILFDRVQNKKNDPFLEEKEEYRQFVQGVLFGEHDRDSTVESSDEEFVPPVVEEDKSYKRRISQKEIDEVKFDAFVTQPKVPIRSRDSLPTVTPCMVPQPIHLNSMQRIVLKTQFMCCAQLIIQLYLLCSIDSTYHSYLRVIRDILSILKSPSASTVAPSAPSAGSSILQQISNLKIFNTQATYATKFPATVASVVDFEAVAKVCDLIDSLCTQVPSLSPFIHYLPKSKRSAYEQHPVYQNVMTTLHASFEPKLKPEISPANTCGGYGSSGRLQFTPSEDTLLAMGILLLGEDYAQIHKTLLGTKDAQQLRNRSKNQRNSKNQRMNIHKRYFSIYSEFKKWDPSVYTRICQLVLTHVTSWQVLQRLYFYFYNEVSLKYYWLNQYYHHVSMMLNTTQSDEIPFFLITPVRMTIQQPVLKKYVNIRPQGYPTNPISREADDIFEKDVLLDEEVSSNDEMKPTKRQRVSEEVEREELTDEEEEGE